jgi:hypothetical protein
MIKKMETTPKDFVLLCIDNEIYRYREILISKNHNDKIAEHAIDVLEEFRQNIVDNC